MRDDRLDPADSDIFDDSAMECGVKEVEEGLSGRRRGELQVVRACDNCVPARCSPLQQFRIRVRAIAHARLIIPSFGACL